MNKSNTEKRDCRLNAASTGSNRAETCIPGTTIPKRFYVTIVLDTKKLIKASLFEWEKAARTEFDAVLYGAIGQIRDYRLRHRIFKFYGCDPGHGFKVEYDYGFCDIDGIIQLLRTDLLPISMRSINAEMDYLDGKLEEVDGVLKPVKK